MWFMSCCPQNRLINSLVCAPFLACSFATVIAHYLSLDISRHFYCHSLQNYSQTTLS